MGNSQFKNFITYLENTFGQLESVSENHFLHCVHFDDATEQHINLLGEPAWPNVNITLDNDADLKAAIEITSLNTKSEIDVFVHQAFMQLGYPGAEHEAIRIIELINKYCRLSPKGH